MIFVYTNRRNSAFWIEDTLIPLDMIWVNSQGKVVSIQPSTPKLVPPDLQLQFFATTACPIRIELMPNANKIGLKSVIY